MTLGPRLAALLLLVTATGVFLIAGCGHTEGQASNPGSPTTVTLGKVDEVPATTSPAKPEPIIPASSNDAAGSDPTAAKPVVEDSASDTKATEPAPNGATDEARTFKVEGPEEAIRVSFDDFDLLKVMNLDPVPADAPERLPKWLKALDGKRIRVRGFMYPPFQDTDIRGFVLARDNQICCFGRTPKEYDLVDTFLRKGVTTNYIQNRPFDVVGVFRIKTEIEKYTAMYELEDAIVIEK